MVQSLDFSFAHAVSASAVGQFLIVDGAKAAARRQTGARAHVQLRIPRRRHPRSRQVTRHRQRKPGVRLTQRVGRLRLVRRFRTGEIPLQIVDHLCDIRRRGIGVAFATPSAPPAPSIAARFAWCSRSARPSDIAYTGASTCPCRRLPATARSRLSGCRERHHSAPAARERWPGPRRRGRSQRRCAYARSSHLLDGRLLPVASGRKSSP